MTAERHMDLRLVLQETTEERANLSGVLLATLAGKVGGALATGLVLFRLAQAAVSPVEAQTGAIAHLAAFAGEARLAVALGVGQVGHLAGAVNTVVVALANLAPGSLETGWTYAKIPL